MATDKDLYNLLGLCQRAGKLISGNDLIENAIRNNKVELLIIAQDIGDSMFKRYHDKASFYNVRIVVFGQKDIIGTNIGKGPRSAVAVSDRGFAESFLKKYQTIHPGVNSIG